MLENSVVELDRAARRNLIEDGFRVDRLERLRKGNAALSSEYTFGADPGGWIERSRRVRVLRPDSHGGFDVDDLPAGEYLIALASDLDPSDRVDGSVLAKFAPAAVKVTLVEGRDVVQHIRVAR